MKKVGIMGGTFNPIHTAHLILAENAYEQFRLDQIVFMPSKQPAYKDLGDIIAKEHRQKMIELAIEGNPHFSIDTMEYEREGNTYTADTLIELHQKYPDNEYYFIVGGDSLYQLEHWNRPQVILSLAHILAAQREDITDDRMIAKIDELEESFHADIRLIHIPQFDISSNMIRERLREGKTVRYFVPEKVDDYIREHGLYQKKEQ